MFYINIYIFTSFSIIQTFTLTRISTFFLWKKGRKLLIFFLGTYKVILYIKMITNNILKSNLLSNSTFSIMTPYLPYFIYFVYFFEIFYIGNLEFSYGGTLSLVKFNLPLLEYKRNQNILLQIYIIKSGSPVVFTAPNIIGNQRSSTWQRR